MWKDSWFPGQSSFKIHNLVLIVDQDAKASEFIDRDLLTWKINLPWSCFDPMEAILITSIPLFLRMPEDKIIWHNEKNNVCSIKSAYHILCAERTHKKVGPSSTLN